MSIKVCFKGRNLLSLIEERLSLTGEKTIKREDN
jgi:hypothetical protein